MNSIKEISELLRAALKSDALFSLVTARVTLRTGVDLATPSPAANQSPDDIQKVVEALSALGYSRDALRIVANRRS